MSDMIRLVLSRPDLSLAPGASGEVLATISNLSGVLDQVSVLVEGVDPSWVQVLPDVVPIFPQEQGLARLIFKVPNEAPAGGPWGLAIRAKSRENSGEEAAVPLAFSIQGGGGLSITLLAEPLNPALPPGTQEYRVRVSNSSALPALAQLALADTDPNVEAIIEPVQVQVAPHGESWARMTLRPRKPVQTPQNYPVTLVASAQNMARGTTMVQFPVQPPPALELLITPPSQSCQVAPVGEPDVAATFTLSVHNPSNQNVRVKLQAQDPQNLGKYSFTPPLIEVPAQGDTTVQLDMTSQTRPALGTTRKIIFTITATPAAPHLMAATATGELSETSPAAPVKPFPWKLVGILGLIALLALCIGLSIIYQLLNPPPKPTATPTVVAVVATTPAPPTPATDVPTAQPSATPSPVATTFECVGAPPPRLKPGVGAFVSLDPPLRNRVRSEPTTATTRNILGLIEPGEEVDILDGPTCADAFVWWRVKSRKQNLTGWTIEGDLQGYWLIPLQP